MTENKDYLEIEIINMKSELEETKNKIKKIQDFMYAPWQNKGDELNKTKVRFIYLNQDYQENVDRMKKKLQTYAICLERLIDMFEKLKL